MGFAFHRLCPRYSGTLTPSAPTAIRLWETFIFTFYCTYIRPLLEHASEVCDGCTQTDVYRLEQEQLIAARIVIGLPVFASLNSIYAETGWKTLADRRKT